MEKEKIERINQLAKKAKTGELTPEEVVERTALRQEYLSSVRQNMRATLDSVMVENEKGEYEALKKCSPQEIAAKKERQRQHHHEHHHDHDENCGCGHHHEHHYNHDENCGCGQHHEHYHDHDESCGCGQHHDKDNMKH